MAGTLSEELVHRNLQRLRKSHGLGRPTVLRAVIDEPFRQLLCRGREYPPGSQAQIAAMTKTITAAIDRLTPAERRYVLVDFNLDKAHSYPTLTERQSSLALLEKCNLKTVRRRSAAAMQTLAFQLLNPPSSGAVALRRTVAPDSRVPAAADAVREAAQPNAFRFFAPPLEPGLIDRTDEYNQFRGLVLGAHLGRTPVVAIAGPGGFGKTTLASQVAHDVAVRESFEIVLWVETGHGCTPARVVELISDICVHLGADRPALADPTQAGLHLARVIGDRTTMLVVDNVWSANDLAPFLLGAPNCLRVVTTRNVGVCPSEALLFRLGTMTAHETQELLRRNLPGAATDHLSPLSELCGGWPLLATVVSAAVGHDIRSGATVSTAVAAAANMIQVDGPVAFDVWDTDHRRNAIGHAISASLRNLDEHVTIPGTSRLRDRYLDLCVVPASTPIPIPVLARWWATAHGWTTSATRRFCRILADRSMISAHLADQDAIILHDVFGAYLRHLVGDDQPSIHRSLLDAFRPKTERWADTETPEYLCRTLAYHLDQAGLEGELADTFSSLAFLADKVVRCGYQSLASDHQILSRRSAGLAVHLTGAGFLLHGMSSRSDIVSTLHVVAARAGYASDEECSDLGFELHDLTPAVEESTGHIGAVVSVAASANVVVSGGEDGAVRVWDELRGTLLHKSIGHTGWIHATAITPDSSIAATGGDDGEIRLWNTASGAITAIFVGHTQRIRALAFTDDGTQLISGAEDGLVCVWDIRQQTMVRSPTSIPVPVWSVAISPDSSLIAVGGEDEYVRLIDAHDGAIVSESVGHRDWVRAITFTGPDTLVSGSGDGSIRWWTVSDRRLTPTKRIQLPDRVRAVAHHRSVLAVGAEDAHIRIFHGEDCIADIPMPNGVDWIRSIAVTETGAVIAACEDGAIRKLAHGSLTTVAPGTNTVWSVAHNSARGHTLLGDGAGIVTVLQDEGLPADYRVGAGRLWSLASAAGYFAAASGDGTLHIRSVTDSDWSLRLNAEQRRTWAVVLAENGQRVAASSDDGHVRAWHLPSGELEWQVRTNAGRIRCLAFNTDGSLLAAACGDGSARLWNSAGHLQRVIPAAGGWSRTVALTPDGTRLAIGSGTGTITIRETTTGEATSELSGHTGRVLLLGFLDNHLVSVAANGTARWWGPTGDLAAEVRVDASCQAAGFDPVRRRVTIAGATGVTVLTVPRHSSRIGA